MHRRVDGMFDQRDDHQIIRAIIPRSIVTYREEVYRGR